MATGTPGHFSGGAQGGGSSYDTATQSFRKAKAPAAKRSSHPGAKSGFASASSTTRPLTHDEHDAAAGVLAQAGLHRASAHHRSAADQLHASDAGEVGNDGDEVDEDGASSKAKVPAGVHGKKPGKANPDGKSYGK